MTDEEPTAEHLMEFLGTLRQTYLESSSKSTLASAQEFDEVMRPLVLARMKEIQLEQSANMPTQGQMLMELVLEVEQVVALVPPKLRAYRELLAAQGLDKTVVVPVAAGTRQEPGDGAEGGREGMPGINLADQAALEFHSQLLRLAFGIAQDEVEQRMARPTPETP